MTFKSPSHSFWKQFYHNKLAVWALIIIFFLTLISTSTLLFEWLELPWLMSPNATDLSQKLLPPSQLHWLGTDHLGRDVFSRILHATPISMAVGFSAVSVSLSIGLFVGSMAGYCGGKTDQFLMRLVDAFLCFPTFFLILTIVALLGPSLLNVIAVIGLVSWTGTARLVRGEFLTLRESEYVQAAHILGQSSFKVVLRHILPNATAVVLITAVLGVPEAILAEAGLSFLGFGVQPPQATWGNIIADGKAYLLEAWWLILFPGFAIFITALAFYLVGDALREAGEK